MLTDGLLAFVPLGGNLSLIAAANSVILSSVVDQLGVGVGQAPPSIIGNQSTYGADMGVGGHRPELNISIGTAVVATASSTLKIAFQGAADPGAAGNYTPAAGDWTDIVSQDGIKAANLTANAIPFRVPWLPTMPPGLRPRFYRLAFTISSLGSFTAGTIASALVTTIRDDYAARYAQKNYSVS
jgi:hypothetical protein